MERQYICEAMLRMKEDPQGTGLIITDPEKARVTDVETYFARVAETGITRGFFLDETETDAGHEMAIGVIRRYVQSGNLPVMAGGRTRRLEDVKKYIYAGARAALIRDQDPGEMAVYEDAVKRFGKTRIALYREHESDAREKRAYVTVEEVEIDLSWSQFKLGSDGLLPCIVQDVHTGQVLMMAYMNEEAFRQTCQTGRMTYYSRSRQSLWLKGETSGHYQYVRSLSADCDWDTLLAKVEQVGVACHTGAYSCFFRPILKDGGNENRSAQVFENLERVIADRKANPKEGSYTNYLFDKGIDKILKKVGEEATEIVIAAKNPDPEEIKYEVADFLYHVMVLLAERGVAWQDIVDELARR